MHLRKDVNLNTYAEKSTSDHCTFHRSATGERPYALDSEQPSFRIITMTKIWQVKYESGDLDYLNIVSTIFELII